MKNFRWQQAVFMLWFIALTALVPGLSVRAQNSAPAFSCTFNSETEFNSLWTVIDANGDNQSWEFDGSQSVDAGSGCVSIWTDNLTKPEYMVLKTPVHLEKGAYHVKLYEESYNHSHSYAETYAVLIGKTSNVSQMTRVLDREDIISPDWFLDFANFNIEEEGDYYMAVEARKNGYSAYYLFVDSISIMSGVQGGTADLQFDEIIPPLSSCELGTKESFIMKISNHGNIGVKKFKLRYTVNGGAEVEKIYNQPVPSMWGMYLAMDTLDLAEEGLYKIKATLEVMECDGPGAETDFSNNTDSVEVVHWTAAEVPFVNNFSNSEDRLNWTWSRLGSFPHVYSDMSRVIWMRDSMPIYSRCLNLSKDKSYKLTLDYRSGLYFDGEVMTENFVIYYNKLGDTVLKPIMEKYSDYTEEAITQAVEVFSPEEDGVYRLVIQAFNPQTTIGLSALSLTEMIAHDIALTSFGPLPAVMPLDHISGTVSLPVSVKNEGSERIDTAKVEIYANETLVGSSLFPLGATYEEKDAHVEILLNNIQVGDTLKLTAKAVVKGYENEDSNDENNQKTLGVKVSDVEVAYDNATEGMCQDYRNGIGPGAQYTVGFGIPMFFSKRDTLTGLKVFWCESPAYEPQIAIYKLDEKHMQLGDVVYSTSVKKTADAGVVTYPLPSLMLDAGYYMVCLGIYDYAVVSDWNPDAVFYQIGAGEVYPVEGVGMPAYRAVFGHDGNPVPYDAAVVEIRKPADRGLFSANEPIEVVVANNGYQTASVEIYHPFEEGVSVQVDVPAYSRISKVFYADLSQTGWHVIHAKVRTDNDGNPANDTLTKTVYCVEPADPYVMDFEYCEDFAIGNFNPGWQTVNMDEDYTISLEDTYFPNMGTRFAYIVFNPAKVPGLQNSSYMAPSQGERYGAAFSPLFKDTNNDWLVSPLLELPQQNAQVSLLVKSATVIYGYEKYRILVSGTDQLEDFIEVFAGEAPANEWKRVTVDLSRYAGKSVHIAIQCVSTKAQIFMVDDIRVSKPVPVSNEAGVAVPTLKLYPNPARSVVTITAPQAVIEQVGIYNVRGGEVFVSASGLKTASFRYNVSGLQKGLYFARVRTATGLRVMKFVVE